ncbi:hypothetical protein ASZ78_006940, partial [Callipepla squamata]
MELCSKTGSASLACWSEESNPSLSNQLQEKVPLSQTSPVQQAALQSASQPCPRPVPCPEERGLPLMGAALLCSFQHCFVCGKRGASISCAQAGCDRSFHLPCASEGECVTQYFDEFRFPTWEIDEEFEPEPWSHSRCDASECRYRYGREEAARSGPWELLVCSSCAARGTHRRCSDLSDSMSTWVCNSCAGEGT